MTCAAWIAAGCGGGAWAPAAAVADPQIVTGAVAPRSIDLLPLDVEVWGEKATEQDVEQTRLGVESWLVGAITADLYKRGLQVGAVMDWSGAYVAANGAMVPAMAPPDLLATVNSLARYGERVPPPPAELPVPYLPVRLGATTGADATLYVGGWGFAGVHHASGGEKVAKGVAIVLLVAVAIVVVVALAKSGGGNALGHAAGAVANGAGRVAVSASRAALRAGNVVLEVAKTTARVDDDTGGLVEDVIDAMGHAHAVNEASAEHPDWAGDTSLPHRGDSAMFVEMTLVDNHTGLVLWHAQQRFPADPRHPHDVARAARALLATFPAAPPRG